MEYKDLDDELKNYFVNNYRPHNSVLIKVEKGNQPIFEGQCIKDDNILEGLYEYYDRPAYLEKTYIIPSFVFFTNRFDRDNDMKMYIYKDGKVYIDNPYNLEDLTIKLESKSKQDLEKYKEKQIEKLREEQELNEKQVEANRLKTKQEQELLEKQLEAKKLLETQERAKQLEAQKLLEKQERAKLEEENQIQTNINNIIDKIISESNTEYRELEKNATKDNVKNFYDKYKSNIIELLKENSSNYRSLERYILDKLSEEDTNKGIKALNIDYMGYYNFYSILKKAKPYDVFLYECITDFKTDDPDLKSIQEKKMKK